jgi:GntR family transcriptional regulator
MSRSQTILTSLLEDLAKGKHRVGDMLPTESELARHHHVSRATVRTALLELQRNGMISRQRGSGTRVLSTTPAKPEGGYSQYIASFEDIVQYADTTRRLVLSMTDRVADFDLARRLSCRPGSRWVQITMMRVDPRFEAPICWADLFVIEQYSDLLRRELPDFPGAAITLIENRYGRLAFRIQQSIRASRLSEDVAGRLAANPNGQALEIIRRYLTVTGQLIIVTFSLYPSDRFEYMVNLERNEML